MGMNWYPQDLPVVMKLMNKYIAESGKNINLRNINRKDQTGVAFTQTQEKDKKYKKKTNIKGKYHCLYFENQGHWADECPGQR